jgi:hypothetical protein
MRILHAALMAIGLLSMGAGCTKWVGSDPPRPRLLMHQLGALRGSTEFPHLDSHVFAQQVQSLLAQLPTSTGAAALAHQAQE